MNTLEEAVDAVRSRSRCSVVLPAGAGKTHLIVQLACALAEEGNRTLLLTHTNAGGDVMRRRLRRSGAGAKARVRTIAGWSLDLIGRVPLLAGIRVGAEPDWSLSSVYVEGARQAVASEPISDVLRASYDFVLVDEYQDCTGGQHALVCEIAQTLPTAIFGDPLQALFDFGGADTPPNWTEVESAFPPLVVASSPQRWRDANTRLGDWLLCIRDPLSKGKPIELDRSVVNWIEADADVTKTRRTTCLRQPSSGSVVALGRFRADCAAVARGLNGTYALMEELEGAVMMAFAATVDVGGSELASATVDFAIGAVSGLASAFSSAKRSRLKLGKPVATRDDALRPAHEAVNHVLESPTPRAVASALRTLGQVAGAHLYCHEAWSTVLSALDAAAASSDTSVAAAVLRSRNLTRVTGRRPTQRVVSRPRLVKGLEFDHAVLLDADQYDRTELYVALSRPRYSLTVISARPNLAG